MVKAQEKVRVIIRTRLSKLASSELEPALKLLALARADTIATELAAQITLELGELGYRKLPQEKPPLLKERGILRLLGYGLATTKELEDWQAVAQAQREVDIKHYEG